MQLDQSSNAGTRQNWQLFKMAYVSKQMKETRKSRKIVFLHCTLITSLLLSEADMTLFKFTISFKNRNVVLLVLLELIQIPLLKMILAIGSTSSICESYIVIFSTNSKLYNRCEKEMAIKILRSLLTFHCEVQHHLNANKCRLIFTCAAKSNSSVVM